jgi:hypothetical protein
MEDNVGWRLLLRRGCGEGLVDVGVRGIGFGACFSENPNPNTGISQQDCMRLAREWL